VVVNSSFTVAQGAGPLVVPAPGVLEGASDPDNDTVVVWNYTAPVHAGAGFAVSLNGSFAYQPAAGYVGRDAFTFVAADGMGNLASGTVSIVVTGEAARGHACGRRGRELVVGLAGLAPPRFLSGYGGSTPSP
jgi:hypothetical protein